MSTCGKPGRYVTHTGTGYDDSLAAWIANGSSYTYSLGWRAPNADLGRATFFVAGNAVNNFQAIEGDHYYQYKNAAGDIINSGTVDKGPTDSTRQDVGYVRRPTDRLITIGLFLQDYLATNKNFKVHLNMIYGSNMPFNIPNSVKYRNALIIDPYIRVDIGFSALLLGEKKQTPQPQPLPEF